MRFRLVASVVALFVFSGYSPASADEPFYAGKRLNILVNFAVGGPTDLEGRLFAKYISRHIAGQPSILVQNMDGAGGVVGAKYLGEVAPKDGTYVGYFTGTGFIYALDPSRFRADFRTYGFVAMQGGTTIHYVRTDVPPGMNDPTDIVKAQGVVGGGLSAETSKDLRMRLGLDMLGVPHKYVTGYRSSAGGAAGVPEKRDQHVLGIAADLSQHRGAGSDRHQTGYRALVRRLLRRRRHTPSYMAACRSCRSVMLQEDQRHAAVRPAVGRLPRHHRVRRHRAAHDLLSARRAAGRDQGADRRGDRAQCRQGLCGGGHADHRLCAANGRSGPAFGERVRRSGAAAGSREASCAGYIKAANK